MAVMGRPFVRASEETSSSLLTEVYGSLICMDGNGAVLKENTFPHKPQIVEECFFRSEMPTQGGRAIVLDPVVKVGVEHISLLSRK